MKKDKTILYVGLGLAALLALRYFSKKRTQAGGENMANNNNQTRRNPYIPGDINLDIPPDVKIWT